MMEDVVVNNYVQGVHDKIEDNAEECDKLEQ